MDRRGVLVVDARGRDLRTGHDDADREDVIGEVVLTLRLEPAAHTLVDVRAEGADGQAADVPDLRPLVGARVGSGFRRLLDEALPAERDRGSILYLLLDDLVGAASVSGAALAMSTRCRRRRDWWTPPSPGWVISAPAGRSTAASSPT